MQQQRGMSSANLFHTSPFLAIPQEIRLLIFTFFLEDHTLVLSSTQPSNAHYALMHTSSRFRHEAGHLAGLNQYLSLRNEREIISFLHSATDNDVSHIRLLDVANDGRMILSPGSMNPVPVSQLHLVLAKFKSLDCLRVFECHRALSVFLPSSRLTWRFEKSMYPYHFRPQLRSYQLYTRPETRVVPFEQISPNKISHLRLSGNIRLNDNGQLLSLQHLSISGVTGTYLDQRGSTPFVNSARLKSFLYAQGDRLGFEIRDHFLLSIISPSTSCLQKLILLGCSRLSTAAITSCLQSLCTLEYLAISFITVHEFSSNFAFEIPATVTVLKLGVTNARFSVIHTTEEEAFCDALEETVLRRAQPLHSVFLDLREDLLYGNGRVTRWNMIACDKEFFISFNH